MYFQYSATNATTTQIKIGVQNFYLLVFGFCTGAWDKIPPMKWVVFIKLYSTLKHLCNIHQICHIVRGANILMWSNFALQENLCMLCGGKLLCMKCNFAPHDIFCLSCGKNCPT